MSIVDEREEVFFDTVNYLSSEESVVVEKNLVCHDIGYEIWLSAPQSVKKRKEDFLHRMGFGDWASIGEPETMGLERVMESSGAASSLCVSTFNTGDTECDKRELIVEANCSVEDSDHDWLDDITIDVEREINENYLSAEQSDNGEVQACLEDCSYVDKKKKKIIRWLKRFTQTMRKSRDTQVSKEQKLGTKGGNATWVKMEQNKKRCMECSAVYVGQEIRAHDGLIWTMKFSPDGQYLASGGEDGAVCIWRVSCLDVSCNTAECKFGSQDVEGPYSSKRKKSIHQPVVIPEKIFHVEEEPLHMFHGHTSDVLDLAWSTTNHLLSSSMDKTVRLWRIGSDECLGVFHHSNYVTCVQFNPGDENYFISGSIDGKVRIFGVTKKRVVHWANVRDVVTAICYKPNGKDFVVGSLSGTCHFYETSGGELELKAEIHIQGRKKSARNKITGIQFPKNDSQRVMMITSEDSKIRILDGLEVVRKYRGLAKSGSQMSASFTSSGRHIISVGEDSRIYLWNYDDLSIQTSKQAKTIRSCEHLFFEDVSVALPWSDLAIEQNSFDCGTSLSDVQTLDNQQVSSRFRDSERFSLSNWFSAEGSSRASTTWPEEILPSWELQSVENDCQPCSNYGDHLHQQLQNKNNSYGSRILSATWGLVIVTAGSDGMIRTFNNYGFPSRI